MKLKLWQRATCMGHTTSKPIRTSRPITTSAAPLTPLTPNTCIHTIPNSRIGRILLVRLFFKRPPPPKCKTFSAFYCPNSVYFLVQRLGVLAGASAPPLKVEKL
eukprot:GHVT01073896.1.p1 GENE.GHVT01073896.1~~GHVT01073896.1.p1  ORF type:complete len:104 (-),score=7.85 GHVT01073896.1:89-400(-)